MKSPLTSGSIGSLLCLLVATASAQTCPTATVTTLSANPDTYYPATASAAAGTKSITLGAASFGTTAISAGDMVLIIQMQGAEIDSVNSALYGSAGVTGAGYITNANLLTGYMEYGVAKTAVSLAGGTLTLNSGLTNGYQNSAYNGIDGQYRYQVIRVPLYTDIVLNATIAAPAWNGTSGGVVVLNGTNSINMNSQTITAADSGFRGGAGRLLSGGAGAGTDYVALSSINANASKGEGIAGMPRFVYYRSIVFDNGVANEGYPDGSYDRGAPGNAGGGGTDATPSNNADNAGGGGGGNGGTGGKGGQGWSAGFYTGGNGGVVFTQASASRLVMGGGGGAGDTNDGTGTPGNGVASSGAAGGGIVIVITNTLSGTGTIDVSGASGNTTIVKDGSGGGGAGGSVLLFAASGLSGITVNASGGTGGSNAGSGGAHGPGGGGGGGMVYSSAALAAVNVAGGVAGTTSAGRSNYLATAGTVGTSVQNITQPQLPVGSTGCTTLPVTFLSIGAAENDGTVTVVWSVAEELNVQDYEVQRSIDGVTFAVIATVPRQSAYYNEINRYSFQELYKGDLSTLYYRIVEQDDRGGKITTSQVVAVSIPLGAAKPMQIAPNPIGSSATIGFTSKSQNQLSVRLISLSGVTVWQRQYEAGTGRRLLAMDNIQNLSSGVYIAQCSDGTHMEQVEVLISH